MKILNVLAFIVAMVFNAQQSAFAAKDVNLASITDQWHVLISPAGYAFAIWGLIYSLLIIFVIYLALPRVKSRNDELIYGNGANGMGYLFALNMLFNSFWLIIFVQNNGVAFGLDVAVVLVMLLSALYILK
jgi:benzodiazapine receptor